MLASSLATLPEEHHEHAAPDLSEAWEFTFNKTVKPFIIYLQTVFSALSSIMDVLWALPETPPNHKLGKWGQSKRGLSVALRNHSRILSRRETGSDILFNSRVATWKRDPERNGLLEPISCWVMCFTAYRWEIWVFWRFSWPAQEHTCRTGIQNPPVLFFFFFSFSQCSFSLPPTQDVTLA